MPRSGVPLLKPVTRTIDFGAACKRAWGDEWGRKDVAYDFSNGRIFRASEPQGSVYTPVINATYLNLPGSAGDYVSTPNATPVQILGDIDLRARIDPTSWKPASVMGIVAKWNATGNQRSYSLRLNTDGRLQFDWSPDGTTQINFTSDNPVAGIIGSPIWVRGTLVVDNGAGGKTGNLYLSTRGDTWTSIVTGATSAGTTSIFNSTDGLEVGARNAGASINFTGKIYQAQVYSGINGTLAASFNAADGVVGQASVTSSQTGEIYAVNGNASLVYTQ